ncbi:hypothetical protein ENH_00013120 [Eimeria necatrix]|uniref:Uncharacterized protein n=1 Tax=Eimeria necatrix TaxID=51315 RepID=U6MWF6_9EIME|nr:hypothetical protein ENH_00013120 [Eimeria necatrix]CDJ66025.1 hypothetical protein ENH_00013120 [Eimeria necatrix]
MTCEWGEQQKRLLIEESNAWFDRHGMVLQQQRLPLQLPPSCSSWAEVAAQLQQHPFHLKLLNHQRLLAKRVKANWSFSASATNSPSNPRNSHLPFRLQPLPRAAAAALLQLGKETLSSDFDGLLLTVQSKRLAPKPSTERQRPLPRAAAAALLQLGKETLSSDFDGLLLTVQSKRLAPKPSTERQRVLNTTGIKKVFAGCLIESLASNERQLKALWVNPRLSARSTRLLLQVLLPRAVVEAFALEAFTYLPAAAAAAAAAAAPQQQQQQQQQARVQSFKSVFVDRRDLDLWPRQCWMLLPAVKNVRAAAAAAAAAAQQQQQQRSSSSSSAAAAAAAQQQQQQGVCRCLRGLSRGRGPPGGPPALQQQQQQQQQRSGGREREAGRGRKAQQQQQQQQRSAGAGANSSAAGKTKNSPKR